MTAAAVLNGGLNPSDYRQIFGLTFCRYEHRALIVVGKGKDAREFSRWELGLLGVPHAQAATSLNRVIQHLRIRSMDDLASQAHTLGNWKGLGVTAYAVLLAILKSAGYDVQQVHETDVSYQAMKRRAMKDEAGASPRRVKR